MKPGRHPLGRIGQLAEDLRSAAQAVVADLHLPPGGDAYEYRGSPDAVQELRAKLAALDNFIAGWR